MIPVVVINLPRSADRRDHIAAHLGSLGIPYRLFAAVDGKTLSETQRARYGVTLPIGAMGCAESHLALLREVADGADELVCILEDDVELAPAVVDLLDPAFLRRLPAFDVLRLESGADDRAAASIPIARRDRFEVHIAWRHHMATTAQIFSRAGARKIVAGLNTLPVAIDVALFLEHYVLGLRVIETRPSLARPRSGMISEIGPGSLPPYTWWETFHKRKLRSREWRRALSFTLAWGVPTLLRLRRTR
ncbi:MAG TPA: glycosyltransferase family 25 protein [Xanthobacteraceae bacterium]|nr:glycosyltransferase family 25 protein [Xanthobacteraceae bacterium]